MAGASQQIQMQPALARAADPAREPALSAFAGRLMLLWGWQRSLVALVAGALAALAQAPFDFPAIGFVSFPVLVWLLDGAAGDAASGRLRRLRPFFVTGWWFGFGYFVAGLWWVGNAMLVDIEKYAWALPIAVLILPAGLALFYGLAAALARPLWTDGFGRLCALAAAFAVAEWLRGVVLTGFPWNAIGYAAMPVPPMMQSVTMVGMTGMNALTVLAFCLPALLAAPGRRMLVLVALAVLVAAHLGFGYARLALAPQGDGETLSARLVQPSIDQSRKWDAQVRDQIFSTYLEMSARPPEQGREPPKLIVWPETSVPFILQQRPQALTALGEMIQDGQTLLAGAVRFEGEAPTDPSARFYNSIVAVNSAGVLYDAADKVHLVPLGEFVPFADLLGRFGITKLVELPGGFSAGARRHLIEVAPGLRVAPYICYEVIFPGIVAAEAGDARLVVNVTNDAWFGNSPGPYQHLRQAQLRAVEAGRPMLRAANNGISAAIDSYGTIVDALRLDGVGNLDVALPLRPADELRAARPGLVGWSIVALLVLLGAVRRARGSVRMN
jgi:apolipoprotein N-acyltransferase